MSKEGIYNNRTLYSPIPVPFSHFFQSEKYDIIFLDWSWLAEWLYRQTDRHVVNEERKAPNQRTSNVRGGCSRGW